MSLYRKENNLRKAQARLDKVSKRSKQFQIRFQREQNSRGRFHTRAYIVRGEKEHHSGRGILHKAVRLKYRVKGDKPSVTRFINSQNPQTVKGHIAKDGTGGKLRRPREQWKNQKQRSPYCHIRYYMLFEIYRIWLLCFYQKGVFIMTEQSHYNVGIYVRLSQEDERAGESISIENQKKMLTEYVSKQTGWNLVEIYEDDGYSGTDFNRPGVQELLDDARSGKINLILCKDLSRFGRNYIEVGQYVDYVFPSFNIRFIALSDNVDTLERNSTAMDMMPIVNLFNEWHAASTSKKIRAVIVSNAKQGKYHAPVAPFGYLVGDTEDRLPVVDETNAPHVRMMYKMRSEDASSPQIAKALNAQGVITPSDYT